VSLSGEPGCPDVVGPAEGKATEKASRLGHEEETQSFLVRIWRENGKSSDECFWRGHITNVFSGKRKYVQSFEGIVEFIAGYLPAMGVKVNLGWRSRLWLENLKRRASRRQQDATKTPK
jgi:hypothetical protein